MARSFSALQVSRVVVAQSRSLESSGTGNWQLVSLQGKRNSHPKLFAMVRSIPRSSGRDLKHGDTEVPEVQSWNT